MNQNIVLSGIALSFATGLALMAEPAPALLIKKDKKVSAYVSKVAGGTIYYQTSQASRRSETIGLSDVDALYFVEPPSYREGQAALAQGKTAEARKKFQACREAYASLAGVPGNYSARARLQEMRCAWLSGDFEAHAKLLKGLEKKSLLAEAEKVEAELGEIWAARAEEKWEEVEKLSEKFAKRDDLTLDQRAQVHYLQGALAQSQGKLKEAVLSYVGAMVSPPGGSRALLAQAATEALKAIDEDEGVQKALEAGAKEGSEAQLLQEAQGIIKLWEQTFGAAKPVPSEFKKYAGK